jgi:hypothetical protein
MVILRKKNKIINFKYKKILKRDILKFNNCYLK